jgi:hypothetical protein
MRSKFAFVTPGEGGSIKRTPNVTATAASGKAIRSRRFFDAMFESGKMEPTADFLEDGFVGIVPTLADNAIVHEANDGHRRLFFIPIQPKNLAWESRGGPSSVCFSSEDFFNLSFGHPILNSTKIHLGDARMKWQHRWQHYQDAKRHGNGERQGGNQE